MMKSFDWSVLLPIAGGGILALGKRQGWDAMLLVTLMAALLFVMFLVALLRFSRLRALEQKLAEEKALAEETAGQHRREMEALNAKLEKKQADFLSRISHSLRMPLAIIQGYGELIQQGTLDPATESEYLDKIVQHTYRMSDALSGRLTSPNEETPSVLKQVELVNFVDQLLQNTRATAAASGVTLQSISPERAILVNADPRQLQHIFYNLVENAMNYMGRDGMLTVLLTQADGMAQICVRDDGLGLPEEEVDRVFEARFQGSNRTPGKGSGNGLYLVRQSVEAQGGTVSASSRPGQGMSIRFTLPLTAQSPAPVPSEPAAV